MDVVIMYTLELYVYCQGNYDNQQLLFNNQITDIIHSILSCHYGEIPAEQVTN